MAAAEYAMFILTVRGALHTAPPCPPWALIAINFITLKYLFKRASCAIEIVLVFENINGVR